MRTTALAPGASPVARRPAATAATVAGISAAPALGGLCWAFVAWQVRLAKRAPRPYIDAHDADGLVGTAGQPGQRPLRVVWLGDSLAAGLGVDAVEDTPARLVSRMLERSIDLSVLAKPGATSGDVLEQQVPALAGIGADLVVLCVGANDVARLSSRSGYALRLDEIVRATAPIPTVVLSLPDMAMPDRLAQPLRSLAGMRARWFEAARARVVACYEHATSVDVASRPPEVSRRAGRALLCADKFHPGPEAYRVWAERIADACHRLLTQGADQPTVEGLFLQP
jgi:lysophospholipase L1-like esterase